MRNFYNPQPCFEIKQNFDNFNFNEHYIQNPNCSCPPKIMPSPHNNCFEYNCSCNELMLFVGGIIIGKLLN